MVTFLFVMAIAIVITTTAAIMVLGSARTISNVEQGTIAYSVAESGVENAILRLLRDRNYTGETLQIEDGSAEITVVNGSPILITSKGMAGNTARTIQAESTYVNNVLTITSWKEIY